MKQLNPIGSSLYSILIYAFSALLSTFLWVGQWKAAVIRVNLAAFHLHPYLGRAFLIRWYFSLSRNLLRYLFGWLETPIQIRPRDRGKLQTLAIRPSLLLTSHFHHWEALASWLGKKGVPLLGSARPISSSLAQGFLDGLRRRSAVKVVSDRVLLTALNHLKAGRCFGILWDQFSRQSRHSTPLFGMSAAMDPLPEILVRRYSPVVIAGFLLPTGVLRLVQIHPEGRSLPSSHRLSRRYHRVLEIVVRAHPTSWYGLSHARLKDVLAYPNSRDVSRETSEPSGAFSSNVSRETMAEKRRINS